MTAANPLTRQSLPGPRPPRPRPAQTTPLFPPRPRPAHAAPRAAGACAGEQADLPPLCAGTILGLTAHVPFRCVSEPPRPPRVPCCLQHPEHGRARVQGCEPGASVGGGSPSALWVCLGNRTGTGHLPAPLTWLPAGACDGGLAPCYRPSLISPQVLTPSPADPVARCAWQVASRGCRPEGHQLGKLWGVGAYIQKVGECGKGLGFAVQEWRPPLTLC